MKMIKLSIREYPKDKKVEIEDLTIDGIYCLLKECDDMKEKLNEQLNKED
jgi:hypothetical protein